MLAMYITTGRKSEIWPCIQAEEIFADFSDPTPCQLPAPTTPSNEWDTNEDVHDEIGFM